ncbi:hypothetical protein CRUP_000106 [Coryphaenoides rupestris]|nr:hypothetical protein CRUP_000106 [Coryphaenoides rupestris]
MATQPPVSLLHPDDQTLGFIAADGLDALCAVEISSKELLLCFSALASTWTPTAAAPANRSSCGPPCPTPHVSDLSVTFWTHPLPPQTNWPGSRKCFNAPYLSVYSESAVDVFDVRPLNVDGSLNLLGLETVRLIYFRNKMAEGDELVVPETSDNSRKQLVRSMNNKRRFSFRVPEEERLQQRREMLRSSSQNGSALRRELSGGSYSSKRHTMTSPSESSLSSGGGVDCGDAPLSQFDREVSKKNPSKNYISQEE